VNEHRLPSLCAQRSFTPLPLSSKNSGENPAPGAQATGLCSASAQSNRAPLPPVAVYNLFVSNVAPDDVFVISPIDKRVDFPVLVVTKQNSAFDTFAKENLGCFRK
jgi:hypothetical protein